jgi:hypothetical protein
MGKVIIGSNSRRCVFEFGMGKPHTKCMVVWLAEQKPLEIVKPKWQSVAIRKYNPVGKKRWGASTFFIQDFFSFLIVKRNQNFVFLMR